VLDRGPNFQISDACRHANGVNLGLAIYVFFFVGWAKHDHVTILL